MTRLKYIAYLLIIPAILLVSCSKHEHSYDAEMCEALTVKIERHDSLTQTDYHDMIVQSEQILSYLVDRHSDVEQRTTDVRGDAIRMLQADPEYMERFGYLFTLGTALYNADAEGRLDNANKKAYDLLDAYNERLAEVAD